MHVAPVWPYPSRSLSPSLPLKTEGAKQAKCHGSRSETEGRGVVYLAALVTLHWQLSNSHSTVLPKAAASHAFEPKPDSHWLEGLNLAAKAAMDWPGPSSHPECNNLIGCAFKVTMVAC